MPEVLSFTELIWLFRDFLVFARHFSVLLFITYCFWCRVLDSVKCHIVV